MANLKKHHGYALQWICFINRTHKLLEAEEMYYFVVWGVKRCNRIWGVICKNIGRTKESIIFEMRLNEKRGDGGEYPTIYIIDLSSQTITSSTFT